MKIALAFILLQSCILAQTPGAATGTSQASTGNCSPNIVSSGSGPVTVQLIGSCAAVDSQVLALSLIHI